MLFAEREDMNYKMLYEAIILQALIDLSEQECLDEVHHFFSGERFRLCAYMAGMGTDDTKNILKIAKLLAQDACIQKHFYRTDKSTDPDFVRIYNTKVFG